MDFDASQQTVAWIKDRYAEGNLELKPPYQRKPVWVARQKSYLIESILLGVPIPEIYMQQVTTAAGTTTYAVVDGQQRLRTILQFIGTDKDPTEQEFNKFSLDKLEPTVKWYDKRLAQLSEDDRKRFYSYKFAVRYLNTDKDEDVKDMFKRLNKYMTPLKPQELRNATYGGPFALLVSKLADDSFWAENRIVSPAIIRRMGDVEFCAELLIGTLHGPQGGNADTIDSYYTQYEDFEDEFPGEPQAQKLFSGTLALIQQLFPDTVKGSRWGNKSDFYTLFVAIASLLKTGKLKAKEESNVRKGLVKFAADVDKRLADEDAEVSRNIAEYTRAVGKGPNDKARRGTRHRILVESLSPHFTNAPLKGGG
jgi:hypothetical protein